MSRRADPADQNHCGPHATVPAAVDFAAKEGPVDGRQRAGFGSCKLRYSLQDATAVGLHNEERRSVQKKTRDLASVPT
ncbi:predicted protein [Chaetomium globosum CBS 148.51]|uniref:Uncharacterized protein n=1 Tax=Chaetomium globosum (strain ATCC 6205 / CBS 148.51 / DSM 1962 / NBRC 6347 / NRRL 1970) TaxID=306901 RepID=Q2HBU3_CHAGB|nr:uncharacterized protein CHGG_02311 [Chaetomium globosum CBS 148.51]EAQ90376.1 predicted protein [Chaetomium globosum CBS 148.51]